MLLQQPHGDPEIQHYEKFQQRINKKNREQDPETHTEVKHAKALFFVSDEQTSAAGR